MKEQFEEWAKTLPPVREDEIALYERHLALLKTWNERMNLVSRNSLEKAFPTHFADSVHIADFGHRFAEGRTVFDLGSGAGFPGIIYAIRYPDEPITLFEKSLKKQSFLLAAVAQLELENVRVDGALPDEKFHGLFLGRAVMQRQDLFPFFRDHLKAGARVIANLGGQTEATSAPDDFKLLERTRYTLPLDAGDRQIEAFQFVPRGTKN